MIRSAVISAAKIASGFIIVFGLNAGTFCQTEPSYDNYNLVWSDEFDVDGLPNANNWGYEKGCSVRNNEAQYYYDKRLENSHIENGILTIEARKESYDGCAYTSASLSTSGKHSWQYGRFEIKARIDIRQGSWPAFWTLGVSEEWPSNGEIDIMEFYQGKILSNIAWGTNERWKATWNSKTKQVSSFSDKEWSSKFHIWRMDWNENSIKLYVDNSLMNSQDLSKTINGSIAKQVKNPFHQKHYIMINEAIGGNNGGDPGATTFPVKYEIDYVRVYQEKSTSAKVTGIKKSSSISPVNRSKIFLSSGDFNSKNLNKLSVYDIRGRLIRSDFKGSQIGILEKVESRK